MKHLNKSLINLIYLNKYLIANKNPISEEKLSENNFNKESYLLNYFYLIKNKKIWPSVVDTLQDYSVQMEIGTKIYVILTTITTNNY